MNSDFENKLEKYTEVIVKVGLNIQPGQRLLIGPPFNGILGVPIELAPLVRKIVTKENPCILSRAETPHTPYS